MKPILVLQMQRLGDLILTFPLLGHLARRYPDNPLWTVAESRFFGELHALAPKTVFFPPEAADKMRSTTFHSVINVSHRADAARIAGRLNADAFYGARTTTDNTHIHGYFALYRASLVHNNRHNVLHWSDMHLLDHCGAERVPHQTAVNAPNPSRERVGLFVGASEPEKRPSPAFFGQLARKLVRKGFRPVFLGGPEDAALGAAAAQEAGLPRANLCGKLSLTQLADILRTLALCVTPDTGPMHLAAWIHVPVLNISVGPVNPWETGPVAPGNHVLRAKRSCAGCWTCRFAAPHCHKAFQPGRVALVIHTLVRDRHNLAHLHLHGLELYRTGRDARGLAVLIPVATPLATQNTMPDARAALSVFWREWLLANAPDFGRARLVQALTGLDNFAHLRERLLEGILALGRDFSRHLAGKGAASPLPHNFWARHKPLLRPLTGLTHMRLQNANYSRTAWENALHDIEGFRGILYGHNTTTSAGAHAVAVRFAPRNTRLS